MKKQENIKRVFFAEEAICPWPDKMPDGRTLDASDRHMTLAFLGNVDYQELNDILPSFPPPPFKVGPAGFFEECKLLPPKSPRVVAWEISWLDNLNQIENYSIKLIEWLESNNFSPAIYKSGFKPHVTISRSPFVIHKWEKSFQKLPVFLKDIHLYESVGNLKYKPLWSYSLLAQFVEIEHTADIAFKVRGENIWQIFANAVVALSFHYPDFLSFFNRDASINNLDDVVITLNEMVRESDKDQGCPFKAVSFHGELMEEKDKTLSWEMIVDV